MAKILAIRHMYSASLFTLEDIFNEKGFDITYAEGFASSIADINPFHYDAVIVLGGAMGVYEADKFPFLHDEIALIQKCLAADHPILGICLGAQLMAAACGERVYKGQNGSEIGFHNIDLTAEGHNSPLHHFAPSATKILQWHGDTFDLPKQAILLASSPQYTNQAYRIGRNGFAVQFHPEVNHHGFENTLVECCNKIDVIAQRHDGEVHLPKMNKAMRAFTDELLAIWGIVR